MIVGTAGHIDHGKTSLIKALTGIDTDRLKEEKERGITIDLGFAYVPLPGGQMLGFVDVPGHERLVHTMIAGAASIEFALLVVAADDGVMPQTVEHLQILELLGVRDGLVALTKINAVEPDRCLDVEIEIQSLLEGTPLAGIDVLPVSSLTGDGVGLLRERLRAEAARRAALPAQGAFRFAVDRSFSLAGVGTVVTGFVASGAVQVGDAVRILPGGQLARVRSMHAENRPAERGARGQRCALNIAGAGIHKEATRRGDWLVDPARDGGTSRFDAELRLLPGERDALRTWQPVHLHHGAADLTARVVILGPGPLRPGESGLAQLVADEARPVRHGDRFILRDAAAQRTIGGGQVLDPAAPRRHRSAPTRLGMLRALREEQPLARLHAVLALPPFVVDVAAAGQAWGLSDAELEALLAESRAVRLGSSHAAAPGALVALGREIGETLAAHHARHPQAPGMAVAQLRAAAPTRLPPPAFESLLAHLARQGAIRMEGQAVRLASHEANLSAEDARLWERMRPLIGDERFRPPRVRDMAEETRIPETTVRRACRLLARMGKLIEVAPDHFFLPKAVAEMADIARRLSEETHGAFTAAQFRDGIGTGRALAIRILEYFDRRGLTQRRGDMRQVVKTPAAVFGQATPGVVAEEAPSR